MKKITLLLLLLFVHICPSFAQSNFEEELNHHCLFKVGSLSLGVGMPISLELSAAGANFRMYYNMDEKFCFGPEYGFFKIDEVEIIDFDFVGHYIFETNWVGIYPLAGANYTVETEFKDIQEVKSALGIVFGLGVHRNFKKTQYSLNTRELSSESTTNSLPWDYSILLNKWNILQPY